jgi:hypothetical protein
MKSLRSYAAIAITTCLVAFASRAVELLVTYTGTVESADLLKGSVDLGGMGTGTFTAKRQ